MLYGVEAQDSIALTAMPGGGGYTAGAVHFAGGIQAQGPTYLNCTSLTATDNGLFAMSFWQKGLMAAGNNDCTLWVTDPTTAYAPWGGQDFFGKLKLYFGLGSSVFNNLWTIAADTLWHHYLFSINTNLASGSKVGVLYVDDVHLAATTVADSFAAFIALFNGKRFMFGDDNSGTAGPTVDIADVWIAPGMSLHDTPTTIPTLTRRQFINADLTPVDPIFFPAAAVIFTGDASSFGTINYGTGGSFTLTGSLTNASTHP